MTKMRLHWRSYGFPTIISICFVFLIHLNHAAENSTSSSSSCPSILEGIPDQVISTGKIFQYKIPDRAFKMSQDAVIEISAASQDSSLPAWISYNRETQEIIAVPTIHDGYGIYLKVTVEDQKSTCRKIFDVFHIAVTSWSPDIKNDKQTPIQSPKMPVDTKKSKVCRGVDLIQTTLIFAVNLKELWAVERFELVKNLARFLGVDSSVITVSTGNELFSTQDNSKSYSILASGHGNTVSIVPNATELTWQVPCSVFPEVHLFVQVLQHNVEGGRLTSEVGHNVVGWYISALVNPSKQQLGRKKRFAQRFMTPLATPVPDLVPATKVRPASIPDLDKATKVSPTSVSSVDPVTKIRSTPVPDIVPTKTVTSTSSSSSKNWWWWPDTDEETKSSSSSIESTTSESFPTDKMTKPFPSQSEIIGYTLTPTASQISPTKSSYFTSSHVATPHTKSPSSSYPETYHRYSSESVPSLSSSSSFTTPQMSIPEKTRHSSDYYTKTRIDISSSKSYSDLDGISGSGDSPYTDEETIPVIETTVLPSTQTSQPVSLFVTPSSPVKKPTTEDIHSTTDTPYAGSGSGAGAGNNDDEETPIIIHPSTHLSSSPSSSESTSVSTPSLSSAIDPSSETNIFYFEETASMSTSKRISSSIYIPSWDTDLFTSSPSSSSSRDVWITKDPWGNKDYAHTRETEVTESSMGPSVSETTTYYTSWPSSRETEHSSNVWYPGREHTTDMWETGYSTVSPEPTESKTTDSIWGGWWPTETEHTKDVLHSSSSTHYGDKITTSSHSYPSSYPDSGTKSSTEVQEGGISPSTDSYVTTPSSISSVFIEGGPATKRDEIQSHYNKESSSKTTDKSSTSVYGSTETLDDCSKRGSCTRGPILEASTTQTYDRQPSTRLSTTPDSTSMTPIMPVYIPTQKKERPTTPEPTTEHRKITKKPRKRPTIPPITKTTDYTNNAPRVRAPIGNVYATYGTVFKFVIPKNTFHDSEDGNTRRLTLDVAYHWKPQRPPTNSKSWLEFDESTQTFTGLPLEEEVKNSPMEVTINAIDKGGRLAQDVINIHVNSSAVDLTPSYEFVMKFEVNGKKFLAERKHLRNLMKKLGNFFGDRDSNYITILDARPGSLILTWTNNSVPTDRCDNDTVHEQKGKIFDDNDRLNPKFRKYMSPRFNVLSAEFHLDGACLDNEPGIGDAETGDIADVNPWAEAIIPTVIAVAIAIFIVVIILLICSQKQRQKKKQKKNEQKNSFEDQDPVMFHSERSNSERGMRSKRAVILPGDVDPNSSLNRNFTPYQAGFDNQDNVSEYDDVDDDYTYTNGSANPPPPYRLPPPYYQDNGSSYV